MRDIPDFLKRAFLEPHSINSCKQSHSLWKPARSAAGMKRSAVVPGDEHLIDDILDAALAVHSCLGCGFVENIYGRALATELRRHDLRIEREKLIKILVRLSGRR